LKVFNRPDRAIRQEIIEDVIVGEFMMDPDRFIQVHEGVAVLEGRVEQRSLLPLLVRAVHGVEGVVQVENRLAYDVDDRDASAWVMASPWMRL
jgi:osmotically-inducible protein OsmY